MARRMGVVEAEWAAARDDAGAEAAARDLTAFFGPAMPTGRAPRVLGLFAHPDDEVFCVGGTIARCAEAGAVTAIASLTHGEAGQIRDAATATRRTLAKVRAKELDQAASALGVDQVTCLDLGDGHLADRPRADTAATVRGLIDAFLPDVVVTFGPDGGFGHPDHIASCLATVDAVGAMDAPPRLLHAKFPMRGERIVDLIVGWLTDQPERFAGSPEFAHALKLFADGSSMLGVAADHIRVDWYPTGSYLIEQGERATELFCLLSGTADVVVEHDDGGLEWQHCAGVGSFLGEEGLATGQVRNAHVIAREPVTCLVLSREKPSWSSGRGATATPAQRALMLPPSHCDGVEDCFMVNVRPALDRKVDALSAHRSQYALEPGLLPASMLEPLLGTERFVVASLGS